MSLIDGHAFIDDMLSAADPALPDPDHGAAEMRFTVRRFVLQLLLDKAITVVPTRDPMPILKCVQVEARPGRLRVVATDADLSMIATTGIVEVETPGVAVFPARKMLDIVREAGGDEVVVRVAGRSASITIGRTTWNLRLPGGEDFPAMPEITDTTFAAVDRAAYVAALNGVRYAASRDVARASLMMLDVRRGRMFACDGARYAQVVVTDEFPFEYQIPIAAVDDLLKLLRNNELPEIHVGQSEHRLIFRLGSDVFIVNKLNAQFPDLEALWLRPALANRHELAVDRGDLLTAVKRVRINADPNASAVALSLTAGRLTVTARDKYENDAEESIDAEWTGSDRTLAVNHTFLTDMISHHPSATLRFRLGDDTRTRKSLILLRDEETGTTAAVQQMNIDWEQQ